MNVPVGVGLMAGPTVPMTGAMAWNCRNKSAACLLILINLHLQK